MPPGAVTPSTAQAACSPFLLRRLHPRGLLEQHLSLHPETSLCAACISHSSPPWNVPLRGSTPGSLLCPKAGAWTHVFRVRPLPWERPGQAAQWAGPLSSVTLASFCLGATCEGKHPKLETHPGEPVSSLPPGQGLPVASIRLSSEAMALPSGHSATEPGENRLPSLAGIACDTGPSAGESWSLPASGGCWHPLACRQSTPIPTSAQSPAPEGCVGESTN